MSQIGALFSGLWSDAGLNFVNEQGGKSAVFGSKPDVAPFVPTDLSDETGKAVGGNLENFDSITAFLNKIAPGFSDILGKGLGEASQLVEGIIPEDVAAAVQRSSAFNALAGGFAGSGMSKALSARDFGLTSLNLMQMGNNAAQQWTKTAEEAYSPFTVSTSEQAAVTANNNAGKQATDQFKFNVDAAPDPGAAGVFNVDAALGQQMLSLGGSFLGGAMGGGGGGGSTAQTKPYVGYGTPGYVYDSSSGQYVSNSAPSTDWRQNATSGAWSDSRLKHGIRFVRQSPLGYKIYRWMFNGSKQVYEGLIAQNAVRVNPDCVWLDDAGYMRVAYGMTDVQLVRV